MIPRMRFSINVELELFAADCINTERRKKYYRRADVNNINHRFRFKIMNEQAIALILSWFKQTVDGSQSNLFISTN